METAFVLEIERIAITTSIGAVLYSGEAGVSPRDLTKRADDLLYSAKAGGRNRYCVSSMTGGATASPKGGDPLLS